MLSVGCYKQIEELSIETRDIQRAIIALMGELETEDWYYQNARVCIDAELKAIFSHNRDEEIKHASKLIEWIRRHNPCIPKELKDSLLKMQMQTKIKNSSIALQIEF